MRDQLYFGLEAPLPSPGVLAPMLPILRRDAFSSADYAFTPSFGGRRVLVRAGSEVAVAAFDAGWLAAELPMPVSIAARSAVLDAELVAVDGAGRPSATGRITAVLAFDLLHLDGVWLVAWPLEKRLAALDRLLDPARSSGVVALPWVPGDGMSVHAAAGAGGLAGMLARRLSSPYLPGVRSRLWRFVPAGVAPEAAAVSEREPAAPVAPLLAVIRRLPLDFGE
jgi:ATP-dependent DNA ligase